MRHLYYDNGLVGDLCQRDRSGSKWRSHAVVLQAHGIDLDSTETTCISDLGLVAEVGGAGRILKGILKGRPLDLIQEFRKHLDLPKTSNDLFDLAVERNNRLDLLWEKVYQSCDGFLTAQHLVEQVRK